MDGNPVLADYCRAALHSLLGRFWGRRNLSRRAAWKDSSLSPGWRQSAESARNFFVRVMTHRVRILADRLIAAPVAFLFNGLARILGTVMRRNHR